MGTHFQKSTAPLPANRHGFVVGFDEEPYLLEGWTGRAIRKPEQIPYRLTDERASFRLRVNPDSRQLKILMVAPVIYLKAPFKAEVFMESLSLGEVIVTVGTWVIRRFNLPSIPHERIAEFSIQTKTPLIPAKQMPNNPYLDPAGCYIGAVLIESGLLL